MTVAYIQYYSVITLQLISTRRYWTFNLSDKSTGNSLPFSLVHPTFYTRTSFARARQFPFGIFLLPVLTEPPAWQPGGTRPQTELFINEPASFLPENSLNLDARDLSLGQISNRQKIKIKEIIKMNPSRRLEFSSLFPWQDWISSFPRRVAICHSVLGGLTIINQSSVSIFHLRLYR